MTLLALLAACTEPDLRPVPTPPVELVSGPEIVTGPAGLAAAVALEADAPVTVELLVEGGGDTQRLRTATAATAHEIPVLELLAETEYTVTPTLVDGSRREELEPLAFTTGSLPAGFPSVDVLVHDPERMEPGLTLIDVQLVDAFSSWLVAVDDALRVVWWTSGGIGDLRQLPSGNLFGLIGGRVVELDVLGREVRSYGPPGSGAAVTLDLESVHHEVVPLDDGGFVVLSNEVREAPSLPRDYEDPWAEGPSAFVRDGLIAVVDADGTLREAHLAGGGLDTHHIGWYALDRVGDLEGRIVYDWAHANAVLPIEDDGFLVSLRHQDAVVRLEADGSVRWVLSDPIGWDASMAPLLLTAQGDDFRWPMHQHAIELTDDGDLVLFDNRNEGASPYYPVPTELPSSRVAAYHVDEDARTVREVWSYEQTGTGLLYSPALGDADTQPETGNVVSLWGFVSAEDGQPNLVWDRGVRAIRLIEFDPTDGSTFLDVRLSVDRDTNLGGCTSYRAERVETLYPPSVLRLE